MQKILQISKQTLWQIIVKFITTASGFIVLGIITRNYGEIGTGNFTLALTYLAFFYILADFSFNALVLRRVSNESREAKSLEWRKLLGARITLGIILTILAVAIAYLLPSSFPLDFRQAVFFGSLIILFYAVNITSAALFQMEQRYELDIIPTLLGVLVCVLIVWYGALMGWPVAAIMIGYTVAWFIHSLGSYLTSRYLSNSLVPIFNKKYSLSLFKSSLPLAGTLFLNVIYFRADAFLVSAYKGAFDVGLYNLSYQIFQAVLVLPTFIMNSFYPMMLQSLNTNKLLNQVKTAAFLLLLVSLLISSIIYFLSPLIIKLITGSGFFGSVTSLQILSFGFPAYFLSSLLMWVMVTKEMYKKLLLIYLIGLIINLGANLYFIPQHSYIAASWITGISEYLILSLQLVALYGFSLSANNKELL